jgi:[CysO sulfur-carrier protein]-S-L-cysteine hydrolase
LTPSVRIYRPAITELRVLVQRIPDQECCGLLAGYKGVITRALSATNAAIAPATSYEIALPELFQLMREIRDAGLEMLGIYHSHPNGKNEPSPRDIAWAYYPDVAYFIISPLPEAPRPVRAFSIRDGGVTELEIQIVTLEGEVR